MELYIIIALLLLIQVEVLAVYLGWRQRHNPKGQAVFIDTSVLMDGRIPSIIRTGFIPDVLMLPSSVLHELQMVADGSDSDKRARARHGLDIATELTESGAVKIIKDTAPTGVDDTLIALAQRYNGRICTIDYNLNKVATARGIKVLNIQELVQELRVSHLPGERVSIKITQKGSDSKQGVGYLADGTMVVVDNASSDIGSITQIEVIRSIQTAAGRMIFAKKTSSIDEKKPTDAKKPLQKSATPAAAKLKSRSAGRKPKRVNPEDSLISLVENQ